MCEDAPVSAPDQPPDKLPDGTRRTQLANERTYLAWLRTGLAEVAVGLAIAKLLPTLHEGAAWPYVGLGAGFCLLGLSIISFGVRRLQVIDRALRRGEYAPVTSGAAIAIGAVTGLLSIFTIFVVLLNR
jgi:putative membrane protein